LAIDEAGWPGWLAVLGFQSFQLAIVSLILGWLSMAEGWDG